MAERWTAVAESQDARGAEVRRHHLEAPPCLGARAALDGYMYRKGGSLHSFGVTPTNTRKVKLSKAHPQPQNVRTCSPNNTVGH